MDAASPTCGSRGNIGVLAKVSDAVDSCGDDTKIILGDDPG